MRYISVGRRFAALLLDWIILLVVAIPLAEIHSGNGSFEISWLGWRFALAWIAVPLTYVVLFEWLASATPGKFMVGIRVRKDTGGRIGFGQSLGRNAARLIDGLPYVIPYLVGGLVVLGSDTRQRLGDRWASTVVIAKGTDGARDRGAGADERGAMDRATAAGAARFATAGFAAAGFAAARVGRRCDTDAATPAGGLTTSGSRRT